MNNIAKIEILLVEDNPDDLDMTLRALRKANLANTIHVARDGAEALEFAFCQGPHAGRSIADVPKLVLLDLKLPKIDGLEVLRRLKGDPRTKTIVFSDGLSIPVAIELYERFHSRIKVAFGVGTNLTNDLGYTPLQIVIKMVRCNGQPVAKLSDTPAKNMCEDQAYLQYLRQVFEIKNQEP